MIPIDLEWAIFTGNTHLIEENISTKFQLDLLSNCYRDGWADLQTKLIIAERLDVSTKPICNQIYVTVQYGYFLM